MRFSDLEKNVRKMQVMNGRGDVSFESIEMDTEKGIGYKRLWIVIQKGFSNCDCLTMMLHVSRFDNDNIKCKVKICKNDYFKESVIYEKIIDIDTVSSANNFLECAIQAFIA